LALAIEEQQSQAAASLASPDESDKCSQRLFRQPGKQLRVETD